MEITEIKQKLLKDIKKLKAEAGWLKAGWPRYHTLFGRDSLISSWQLLPIDPGIAKSTLSILAQYQGEKVDHQSEEEPGKILHEYQFSWKGLELLPNDVKEVMDNYRKNVKFPYYGSVDSTLLFIILAGKYFNYTQDEDFLESIWENLKRAYQWIKKYGDQDGDLYVEYKRKNPYGNYHQGWKDIPRDELKIKPPVAMVEVQGYAFLAFNTIYKLAKFLGKNDLAQEAKSWASQLKEVFHQDFWMENEKYCCLALDGDKKQKRTICSNQGHLLFTGILNREEARLTAHRLFQPDLWSPYGIRTLSSKDERYDPYDYRIDGIWPHDNWIIWKGLLREGFETRAKKLKGSLIKAYHQLGKMPEVYSFHREIIDLCEEETSYNFKVNPIHTWSSGALLNILSSYP